MFGFDNVSPRPLHKPTMNLSRIISLLLFNFLINHTVLAQPTTGQYDQYFCQDKVDGVYPVPTDCHMMYSCQARTTIMGTCRPLLFNPATKDCDLPANVQCNNVSNTTENNNPETLFCQGKPDGIYADPNHCGSYYSCFQVGTNGHHACPSGLLFNSNSRFCDLESNVICSNEPASPMGESDSTSYIFCDGKNDGIYADHYDCSKYYNCSLTGIDSHHSCRSGLMFTGAPGEPSLCDLPTNVECGSQLPILSNAQHLQSINPVQPGNKGPRCQVRICYYTNWAQHRLGAGKFNGSNIDPFLCTHIVYAFAQLEINRLVPSESNDESTPTSKGGYEEVTDLKKINPSLKVLLAVGGSKMGSTPFSQMVKTRDSRAEFITSTVDFLKDNNFDGLDLHWEYPANTGSPPEDRNRFTLLVSEMRQFFEDEAKARGAERLLLTAAVAAHKDIIDSAYDIPAISSQLDFINLMSYDFHGGWEGVAGYSSPLYAGNHETGVERQHNIDWAANYWVNNGCPKNKLVIGLSLYGRSYQLTGSSVSAGSPAVLGIPGTFTRNSGYVSYYEVCGLINGANLRHYDSNQRSWFITLGQYWFGYDNPLTISDKVRYIRDSGFAGVMAWSIDMDDFSGHFCNAGAFPLLNSMQPNPLQQEC